MSRAATSEKFVANARRALADADLQGALGFVETTFPARRRAVVEALPEFDALRDSARDIKVHTLAHLDLYLAAWEERVTAQGGRVHWAATAADANDIVLKICRDAGARTVTKGKSMVGEEIGVNEHLAAAGIVPVETDLGEYIVQIRDELPSHIIMPAVHLNRHQIAADFRRVHTGLPKDRDLSTAQSLLTEARATLRKTFLAADVGITGANFLIAETGSSVIVTNEGNGDLTCTLPRVHIVLASIEKVIPTLEDLAQLLRVLARSATAQEMSVYTTITTGPRRADDPDGPHEYHVVVLDNGRSAMLAGEFRDMLRCIRCGACMNHCPVYHAVGGHAYGFVYPGPMGAVLTPSLLGVDRAGDLPNASTFCGRCEQVCPVKIPLPRLMRHWRDRDFARSPASISRAGLALWGFFAARPRLYRVTTGLGTRLLARLGRARGHFRWLPLAGGFTATRDIAAPQGATFQQQWRARAGRRSDRLRTVPSGNPHGRGSEPQIAEPQVADSQVAETAPAEPASGRPRPRIVASGPEARP
ncbi:lactate utilization protein B [Rhodoplanes azumiensis]|uniref:Lactate utilization protein B n=1 Tax=Rhodoplanes azumiensis TaxID=1897628 RepID=A0ABW5AIM1_9BRAD